MKIAYYLHWNDVPESGVFKKIISQTNQWIYNDLEVKIFLLTRNRSWNSYYTHIPIEIKFYNNNLNRLTSSYSLVNHIIKWEPDIIYTRYDLYNPVLELLKNIPLIFEVNADDLMEYSMGSFFREKYNILTRRHYLKMADGIIFVTEEISKRSHFKTNKRIKVISNGIDLQSYSILPPPQNKTPNLVFIGSEGQPWHGIDKIEILAGMFPEWIFHIIGNLGSKEDINDCNNIIYYPFLNRQEYEQIIANADIAIGSLASYRKGLNQACPLKVREYLAYGLPVIIGYEDIDIIDFDGVLQISNDSNNVYNYKEQIYEFVQEWKGKRSDPNNLKINAKEKESERIKFFKEIIENKM